MDAKVAVNVWLLVVCAESRKGTSFIYLAICLEFSIGVSGGAPLGLGHRIFDPQDRPQVLVNGKQERKEGSHNGDYPLFRVCRWAI